MKKIKIPELTLADKIRKDILELLARSYEDTHPFSLIMISLAHIGNKYSEDFNGSKYSVVKNK